MLRGTTHRIDLSIQLDGAVKPCALLCNLYARRSKSCWAEVAPLVRVNAA
jgi:hypothetical protein